MENTDKVFTKSDSFKNFKNLKKLNYKDTLNKIFNIYEKNHSLVKQRFDSNFQKILNKSL